MIGEYLSADSVVSTAFIQTSFYTPKLAVTVTVSFRDDPKLDKILSIQNTKVATNGAEEDTELQRANEEEEEYMDDSYDGEFPSFAISRLTPS